MKLFVRNLPFGTTEDELRELFEAAGTVVEVKIVTDRYTGKSRGFGFITMSSAEEAEAAIEKISNTELNGRTIFVDKARDNAKT